MKMTLKSDLQTWIIMEDKTFNTLRSALKVNYLSPFWTSKLIIVNGSRYSFENICNDYNKIMLAH